MLALEELLHVWKKHQYNYQDVACFLINIRVFFGHARSVPVYRIQILLRNSVKMEILLAEVRRWLVS